MALDWTREEEILALAVYIEFGSHVSGKIPDTTHAAARELSDTLRRLSAHPAQRQNASYRSVNSVRLRGRADRRGSHGRRAGRSSHR